MRTRLNPAAAALRRSSPLLATVAGALALAALPSLARGATPEVNSSVSEAAPSTDGTFTLSWGWPEEASPQRWEVQLEMPGTDRFEDWYLGSATESFVSGIPSGEVRVRVRAESSAGAWSDWSEPTVVPIAHHGWGKAIGLLALGAVVFAAIVALVGVGAWKTRAETVS